MVDKLLILLAIFLAGCGTTTERQTKTVETEKIVFGPMVADTPVGTITIQPTSIVRQRVQDEIEKTEKSINLPDPTPLIAAVSGGTPWGTIISSIVGLGAAAFAGKKAIDNGRQRDEVIDGVERAKAKLTPDQAAILLQHLEAEQSTDTKKAVQARTA